MAITWQMGSITFHFLSDGTFKGDGGVFFGVVPKAAWQHKLTVDADNTFAVPCRPVLAEVEGKRILIETGMGAKHDREGKFARHWGIDQPTTLQAELAGLDIEPKSIDTVILTHLHFDHCGWNTYIDDHGRIAPTFPRARHLAQRAEYAEARFPGALGKNSYFVENLVPVEEAGLWDLVEGDTQVMPGVDTIIAGGHVPTLQMVRFESQGQVMLLVSDLIPTTMHMRPAWNAAYDLDPAQNSFNKQRYLAQAAREGWFICFYHDPGVIVARIDPEGRLEPVVKAQ